MSSPRCPTRRGRRRSSLPPGLLGALLLAVGAVTATALDEPPGPGPNGTDGTPGLPPGQEEDLRFLAAILLNPANDHATRTGAAARLLRMEVAPATSVLDGALRHGDASARRAVLAAMGAAPRPPAGLLEAAVHALRTATPETLDELALVLPKYDDDALPLVMAVAGDRTVPLAERLGPIHALGAFPNRTSGDQLMELVDPRRREDEPIRAAAFDSLRRLAQLDLDDDYAAWRDLWNDARDKSPEQWVRELARQYQERNAELNRRLDEMSRRLVELLREHYRSLESVAAQLERLPRDLDDGLAPVRELAMGRIERLLRDSEPIPDILREKLVGCLDDESPVLRRRAAELLDELDEPGLAELIAERLPAEHDRRVVAGYLELLAHRPTLAALDSLIALLDDEQLGPASATTLWNLLGETGTTAEQRQRVAGAVREALPRRGSPPLARIIAFIGTDEDVAEIMPRLEDANPALRAAVAEGLLSRGVWEPLIARAGDEAVYPYALLALARGPADLDRFGRLVETRLPASGADAWAEAVRTLADRLPPTLVLEADRILAGARTEPRLRAMVLTRAALRGPDALPPETRVEILAALAPLLIDLGEAQRAFELLDELNGSDTPPLVELKFRAAVLAGRYEAAVLIHDDPRPWVALLTVLVESGPEAAVGLCDEIARRFADRLEGQARIDYDAAAGRLPGPAPPPETEAGATSP